MTTHWTLASGFLRSVAAFGARPALEVAGEQLSYSVLFERAAALAATLQRDGPEGGPALTAVFGGRSAAAFVGVLGTLLRGHGYVPLNPMFPPERNRTMLTLSGCRTIVVDAAAEELLDRVLGSAEHPMLVVLLDRQDAGETAARWPQHRVIGANALAGPTDWRPADVPADSIAYLLFTSGSTGQPKGVMVAHRNVRHYVEFVADRFQISEDDRLSQTFDMTFDLSVADMFVAWERGACVCCPSARALLNPGRFINDSRLTIWFSVPSVAIIMKRLGALKAGKYPGLRVSLFCGEALPVEVASAWASAAPNSVVENVYGPTELTIACTYYRWDPERSPGESVQGIVPIGRPFPGMLTRVVDESLAEVEPGADGELLMTGPQLSLGYWQDPGRTSSAFVELPGTTGLYYRTGDRVRRPVGDEPMVYLGRSDNQVKLLGHRVELGEVEAVVRAESGVDGVVALGWPRTASGVGGIEVFLETLEEGGGDLNERVSRRLPSYMVPRHYHYLERLPVNSNGKYDRRALASRLEPSA